MEVVFLSNGKKTKFTSSELLTEPDHVLFVLNALVCEHGASLLQSIKGKKVSLPENKVGTIVGLSNGLLHLSCGDGGGTKQVKLTSQRFNQLFGQPCTITRS